MKEAVKPLDDTARAIKREFCRGQEPQAVSADEYNALDEWSRQYVRHNAEQWLDAGCSA